MRFETMNHRSLKCSPALAYLPLLGPHLGHPHELLFDLTPDADPDLPPAALADAGQLEAERHDSCVDSAVD